MLSDYVSTYPNSAYKHPRPPRSTHLRKLASCSTPVKPRMSSTSVSRPPQRSWVTKTITRRELPQIYLQLVAPARDSALQELYYYEA